MPTKPHSLLQLFLETKIDSEAMGYLNTLIQEHARPAVLKTVAHELRFNPRNTGPIRTEDLEAEEVQGEALAKLVARLWQLRSGDGAAIKDFCAYAATIARHECAIAVRKKYPGRYRLGNHLRYILSHDTRLAIWESNLHTILSGLAGWRDQQLPANTSDSFRELQDHPNSFAQRLYPNQSLPKIPDQDLIHRLFVQISHPILFNAMVGFLCAIKGIQDAQPQTATSQDDDFDPLENAPSLAKSVGDQLEILKDLQTLWEGIMELSFEQRCALLLNLRDSQNRGVIALLSIARIASLREIVQVLEISEAEFGELPMEDAKIAEFLSRIRHKEFTRQQVINLRKSARERLARLMSMENDH